MAEWMCVHGWLGCRISWLLWPNGCVFMGGWAAGFPGCYGRMDVCSWVAGLQDLLTVFAQLCL